jgi:hypothetical protein
MKKLCFLLGFLITGMALYAQQGGQNKTCETAAPFCTGTLYSFPAGVNAPAGQVGPNYGCLTTRPNPAWYYMRVANPGNIIIQMHSEPARDIDFCCWGPFTSQFCCGQLTSNKIVSCSYSTSAYETCTIPNGLSGEYYMLIITNYSNQPCNIIFQQTGGNGTTDCSILPPPCASNSPICTGQTIQLSAQSVGNATYNWWGPAGFTSNLQNPTITNATPANAGVYSLRIVVNGTPSNDTSHTLVNVYQPIANAGNDSTIMNGVTTTLHGSCNGGSGAYHYKWTPANKLVNDSVPNPQTVNLFSNTVFTLKVIDDSASCQATDNVTISVAGGALAVNAMANPSSICYGATTQLQAMGSGGAGNYTYQWTGPNGFSSTLPNPSVAPAATGTYQVTAFDGYNYVTSSVTVTVIPLPQANAGDGKAIPYGTYTFLAGSVTGGGNNYFYSWSPADKLVNAGIQSPQTTYLNSTTVYSLVVTDLMTNCVSSNTANVTIEVTGGPLNVNPVALPAQICKGDSTQLHAAAGGGNVGFYSYSWSSDPPGFSSTIPDPYVHPVENTTYYLSVTDQFNSTTGSTQVGIYPQPVITLGSSDTTNVCVYEIATLDAGNPGSAYLWSNGATTRSIQFTTTGIGLDLQKYAVEVTNEHGCKSKDSIVVFFSFDFCTGVEEQNKNDMVRLFPNPAHGTLTIECLRPHEKVRGEIINPLGKVQKEFEIGFSPDGKSSLKLDVDDLAKGIYLVRFSGDTFTHVKKLFIE